MAGTIFALVCHSILENSIQRSLSYRVHSQMRRLLKWTRTQIPQPPTEEADPMDVPIKVKQQLAFSDNEHTARSVHWRMGECMPDMIL